jgi:hypothetical protein
MTREAGKKKARNLSGLRAYLLVAGARSDRLHMVEHGLVVRVHFAS